MKKIIKHASFKSLKSDRSDQVTSAKDKKQVENFLKELGKMKRKNIKRKQ